MRSYRACRVKLHLNYRLLSCSRRPGGGLSISETEGIAPDKTPHRAICLSGGAPAALTFAPLAAAMSSRARLILKDLEGYATEFPNSYGPSTEIEGITRVADVAGWHRFHLVGQSFGASVALAFACQHPDRVKSLSLNEPPFVGNDTAWSEEYAALLSSLDDALRMPLAERPKAFVSALTAPGGPMPPSATGAAAEWRLPRSERQGRIWPAWRDAQRGPSQLVPKGPALYLAVGGRTHPAFLTIARWLRRQVPQTTIDLYADRSHFDPPHVSEVGRFAQAVLSAWDRRVGPPQLSDFQ